MYPDQLHILFFHNRPSAAPKIGSVSNKQNIKVEVVNTTEDFKKAFEGASYNLLICSLDSISGENGQLLKTFIRHSGPMLTCFIGDEAVADKLKCDFFIPYDKMNDFSVYRTFFDNIIKIAQKLRIQSELSSMLLHDLRSPAQSIIGYLELLEKEIFGEVNEGQKQILSNTIALGDRVIYLMEELSQVHQFENDEFELFKTRVHLREFIDDALRTLWIQADKKDIKIIPNIPHNLPDINADGQGLERVLINLLTNAIKYSPDKGTVRINVEASETSAHAPMILFKIMDSGPGIPADQINYVFDKYYRVKGRQRRQKGFGLGLFISKLIIEAHGGQIGVYNNREGGSTFYFTLPAQPLQETG